MSQGTAEMLVEKITRDQIRKGQEVTIDFYGGEALLSKPLLTDIAAALHREAERCGTAFTFGMVTNGTLLTRETVAELKPLGFTDAKITLDGPKDIHDQQRRFTSGTGSFDLIVRNVQQTWDLINIGLGGNYSPDNYRRFPVLLDYLLEQGLTPEKVGMIQFAPIMPKANSAKARFAAGCSSKDTWIAEAAVFLREETMRRGFAVHKPTMAACMVDFPQQFVVNYDGSLFKCPAFIGWPELSIGTISDGIQDYSETHGVSLWKNQECLDCPYLPICFGGCRFLTLLKYGVINEVDCRREFYDATLEQTIRQDLHYSVKSPEKHNS